MLVVGQKWGNFFTSRCLLLFYISISCSYVPNTVTFDLKDLYDHMKNSQIGQDTEDKTRKILMIYRIYLHYK